MKKNINVAKIEQVRISEDKTKADIASIIGCSERSYQDKEKGKIPFKVCEIMEFIEHFGLKFEDLL